MQESGVRAARGTQPISLSDEADFCAFSIVIKNEAKLRGQVWGEVGGGGQRILIWKVKPILARKIKQRRAGWPRARLLWSVPRMFSHGMSKWLNCVNAANYVCGRR